MREYTVILRVRCDMSIDMLRNIIMYEASIIDEIVQVDIIDFAPSPVEE